MGERYEKEHFRKLSELQKNAIDWHIKAVLSDEAEIDLSRPRPVRIIHPDEYRDDMREFFACDPTDVQDIERRYRQHLSKSCAIDSQSSSRGRT